MHLEGRGGRLEVKKIKVNVYVWQTAAVPHVIAQLHAVLGSKTWEEVNWRCWNWEAGEEAGKLGLGRRRIQKEKMVRQRILHGVTPHWWNTWGKIQHFSRRNTVSLPIDNLVTMQNYLVTFGVVPTREIVVNVQFLSIALSLSYKREHSGTIPGFTNGLEAVGGRVAAALLLIFTFPQLKTIFSTSVRWWYGV